MFASTRRCAAQAALLVPLLLLLLLTSACEGPPPASSSSPTRDTPASPVLAGTPLARLLGAVPPEATVISALADIDRLKEQLPQTSPGKAFADSRLEEWRAYQCRDLGDLMLMSTGKRLPELYDLLSGQIVAYSCLADGSFRIGEEVLLWRPTGRTDEIESALRGLAANASPPYVVEREGDVVIVVPRRLRETLPAIRVRLRRPQTPDRLAEVLEPQSLLHLWVDLAQCVESAKGASASSDTGSDQPALLTALGFDGLDYYYSHTEVQSGGFHSTGRVQCTGPRRGLLALVGDNGRCDVSEVLAIGTKNFMSLRLDLKEETGETLREILSLVAQASDTDAGSLLSEWAQGLDFSSLDSMDLSWLGDDMAFVFDGIGMPEGVVAAFTKGRISIQAALLLRVRNKKRAQEFAEGLLEATQAVDTSGMLPGGPVGGLPFSGGLPAIDFACDFAGDYLVLSLDPTLLSHLQIAGRTHYSLDGTDEFKEAMATLSEQKGFFFAYRAPGPDFEADLAEVRIEPARKRIADTAKAVQMFGAQMADSAGVDIPATLPNNHIALAYEGPAVQIVYTTEDAILFEGQMSGLVAGQTPLPMLTKIPEVLDLLTELVHEKEAEVKCAQVQADFGTFGSAFHAYRSDHGSLPSPKTGEQGVNGFLGPGHVVYHLPALPVRGAGSALGSPKPYLTHLPLDPFAPTRGSHYVFGKMHEYWVLLSAGPDEDYDVSPYFFQPYANFTWAQVADLTYDPTNGTLSSGDMLSSTR